MPDILSIEIIGGLIAAVLTVMVLSYLIADNPLFQLATHIFIGLTAGYAGTIALHSVLKPALLDPIIGAGVDGVLNGEIFAGEEGIFLVGAWLLIGMLSLKVSPSTSRWGALPILILVSVAAGVIVGGAITGTLIPQSITAMESLNPNAVTQQTGETGFERLVNVLILLVGTLSTLLYFRFSAQRGPTGEGSRSQFMTGVATIGQVFIAITFGTMFAGALMASLIALAERVESIGSFVDMVRTTF